jgi:DNA-binding NarL/FixJ family response regulator
MVAAADIHLLLATGRPAVHDFFTGLGVHVSSIPVAADAVAHDRERLSNATVAAIDVALDPPAGIALCRALHAQRPELPVLAVVCCPQALIGGNLGAVLDSDICGLIDLCSRREDVKRAVLAAARGDFVLSLELQRGDRSSLRDVFVADRLDREQHVRLLELVSLGLPDHEIGQRLHLSPHTVKHRIEYLRARVGARNRIELAAWAGRNGFYGAHAA